MLDEASKAVIEMFKISYRFDGRKSVLLLSGRIEAQHLADLNEQVENSVPPVVLDLAELKLVDLEAVRHLALVERGGIELRSCPAFIREWIRRESPVERG
jgi:hypothetical protein